MNTEKPEPKDSENNSTNLWPKKLAEKWAKIRLGHEAIMMEDTQKVLKHNRLSTAKINGTEEVEGEKDMMVLGDYIANSSQQQPPQSILPKLLLGAGLLATGAGVPYGAGIIADAIKNKPTSTPIIQPVTVDTDSINQYTFEGGTTFEP